MSKKRSFLQEIRENVNSNEAPSLLESIMRFAFYWKWFALGILLTLSLAFLYIRQATPVYRVTLTLMMKDALTTKGNFGSESEELDRALSGASTNVANELHVLQSLSLIEKVVNSLNLHTLYSVVEGHANTDVYNKSPVIVSMSRNDLNALRQPISLQFQVVDKKDVKVSGLVDDFTVDTTFQSLPAVLSTPMGYISFTEREGAANIEEAYRVEIQNPIMAARRCRYNLSITPPSKTALVLNAVFTTPYPAIGIDFLNTLIKIFNNEAIQDNKMEAINTQAFIKERILIVNKELVEVERDVEQYKISQRLTRFESDVQQSMQGEKLYEQQLVQLGSQLDIINSLNDYLSDSKNSNSTIPSNVGVTDHLLRATISEYNRLLIDRQRLSKDMTNDNPVMVKLNEQIPSLYQNILISISSVQKGLNIQRRDVINQTNLFDSRLSSLPTQEREYREISREQQIKSKLFLTLLQKREENALTLAATSNRAKVLDKAQLQGVVSRNSVILILVAGFIGLLIPAVIIFLKDFLQNKIHSRADVERISKVPFLAEIPRYKGKETVPVKENEKDDINEAFRIVRTNLKFALDAKHKVVIFTSTVSGEGKTFVAINTAMSMALLNKKVLLIGMDLRRPYLNEYFNLKTEDGLTLYLSEIETKIDNLIVPSGIHPNLDVLPAGPIPPNPVELLARPTLDSAINKLKGKYEYIFIDSASPFQVTDTFTINRVSDATVYVCRADYSNKRNLHFANELIQNGELHNMLLVMNDVGTLHRSYGYVGKSYS